MNAGWFRRWWRSNPLALLALAAVTGILVTDALKPEPGMWLGSMAAAAFIIACRRPRVWKFVPAAVIGFSLLHALRRADTHEHPLRQQLLTATEPGVRAAIHARLLPWQDGVELDAARAAAEVIAIQWQQRPEFEAMEARLKVVLPQGVEVEAPGIYELSGPLTLPRPPIAPGQFNGADYSLRLGYVAVMKAETLRLVQPEPASPGFHLRRWAESCRQWMTAKLSAGIEDDEEGRAVVLGMALGASSAAGEDVEDAFRNSGTLHVFAVSGLHVVMVAGVIGFFLHWLGLGRMRGAWILMLMVFGYAYITGWRPSAARAAFMIAFVLGAPLFNRQTSLQNSLGAAALLLLGLDTHQLFLPGFQLSFGVLWSIALAATWLTDRARPWTEIDPFLPSVLASRGQRSASWGRRWLASLGSVSVSAWCGSLPLMLGHFRTVTPVGLIANCVLVPMSSICMGCACLSLFFGTFDFVPGQSLVNRMNVCLAHGMINSAEWFAHLPMANVNLGLRDNSQTPVAMRIIQLPGGGAANHLRHGADHWLIDCGNANAWRWVLHPYLRHEGVNRIEGLFLSHGDSGHIGAASQVLKSLKVSHLHTTALEPWRHDPPFSTMRKVGTLVGPESALWRRHPVDDVIAMGAASPLAVKAEVLHPAARDLYEKADDRALVLMLRVGKMRVLWLGDAGFATEKRLLERPSALRCDILIRHQHSADISGLEELLLAAQPRAVISSNDPWLAEERMPERVRKYCSEHGAMLFDLSACGSVSVEFGEEHATLEGFINQQRLILTPRPPAS